MKYACSGCPVALLFLVRSQGGNHQAQMQTLRLLFSVFQDLTTTNLVLEDVLDFVCEFRNCRIIGPQYCFWIVLSLQVFFWISLTRQLPSSFWSVQCWTSQKSRTGSDPDAECKIPLLDQGLLRPSATDSFNGHRWACPCDHLQSFLT